jgi:hypothetical protein
MFKKEDREWEADHWRIRCSGHIIIIIIIILPIRLIAYAGSYLVSVGKPFGKKPTSPISYDCLRASTGFCINL